MAKGDKNLHMHLGAIIGCSSILLPIVSADAAAATILSTNTAAEGEASLPDCSAEEGCEVECSAYADGAVKPPPNSPAKAPPKQPDQQGKEAMPKQQQSAVEAKPRPEEAANVSKPKGNGEEDASNPNDPKGRKLNKKLPPRMILPQQLPQPGPNKPATSNPPPPPPSPQGKKS